MKGDRELCISLRSVKEYDAILLLDSALLATPRATSMEPDPHHGSPLRGVLMAWQLWALYSTA